MSETIIIAIITGGVTLTGNLLSNYSARKKAAVEQAVRDQEFKDKLEVLEKKVDEHNNYGKKFGEASQALVSIQKDIEWLKKERKIS